ncbi:AAA-ATPase-like domain-containing protein [Mycena indigotica]|uniref:AAA-ATPase-like domain-containing protein n=1 Tax=Mycena indigotica TaxID=2126181 RepID=A0A8H6TAY3_9AGAR|nr:AAA-ATPase-like domain-containing protein [Mycena indigotica]KAF7312535.1 AAA-ATPase-like domain-containing protein [Mycena indigotica]
MEATDSPASSPAKREHVSQICGSIFSKGGTIQRLPRSQEEFDDIVNATGVPHVFKLHDLTQLARLLDCRHALLIRRPPGWGLDLFASMVSAAFDQDYNLRDDPFKVLLGEELDSIPWNHHLHDFFVLDLDFSRLPAREDFRTEFQVYLEKKCQEMLYRYRLEKRVALPGIHEVSKDEPEEFISSLAYALQLLFSGPLLVIIRNFDSPTTNYPDGYEVLNPFLNRLQCEVKTELIGSLLLLSSWDDGSVYSCMGRPPLSLIKRRKPGLQPLDLPYTLDLTHDPVFQTAIGISRQEVNALDEAFGHLKPCDSTHILKMMDKHGTTSVFADILPRTHQCPPLDEDGGWLASEVDPLAELDRSREHEGTYPAQFVMKVFALKYGLASDHGSL